MKVIYKYPLPSPFTTGHLMHAIGTKIVLVGLDPTGTPCIWIQGEPDQPTVPLYLSVLPTGTPFSESEAGTHVGSYVHDVLVWHVYCHQSHEQA